MPMRSRQYEHVICADGFTMSVQANAGAYCEPRTNNAKEYTEVEIGYPSQFEELLDAYVEIPDSPKGHVDQVFPYVPTQVVTNVIAKHGGMVEGEVPPGVAPLRASNR